MKEYRVMFRSESGKVYEQWRTHNFRKAKDEGTYMIGEDKVWIDVYEVKRVKRIKIY